MNAIIFLNLWLGEHVIEALVFPFTLMLFVNQSYINEFIAGLLLRIKFDHVDSSIVYQDVRYRIAAFETFKINLKLNNKIHVIDNSKVYNSDFVYDDE